MKKNNLKQLKEMVPLGWHPGKGEERRAQGVRKGSLNHGACICYGCNLCGSVRYDLLYP